MTYFNHLWSLSVISGSHTLQQNQANVTEFYDYMEYNRTMLTRITFSQKRQVASNNVTTVTLDKFYSQ
jgi:hypothetical protein